jgi:hypothetical protein
MADRSGAIARAGGPAPRAMPGALARAALLAAGLTCLGGPALAPAHAAQLSQGVARPQARATQQPRAERPRASASALAAPPPESSPPPPESSTPNQLGFDACEAPSARAMAAWAHSPYRTVGVYIGGLNRACPQRHLSEAWVREQISAGWALIPTYVGRQSPTSGCTGCAKLSARKATAQGAAEAEDAVADAQGIGMGAGSPIYFDMEGYARTAASSRATLAFLEAWTTKLHALGYRSGVYSSRSSGIADLAAKLESGYPEPDDLWIADWNGRADTEAALLPSYAWAPHRRLHQYRGGHNETYGGVTINIDNVYVDGATFGSASRPLLAMWGVRPSSATLSVTVRCGQPPEAACPGQILLRTHVLTRSRPARASGAKQVVRVAVARRGFHLAGGRRHVFRIALNPRGRRLLRTRGTMRVWLLAATPGARATRVATLSR